MNYKFSLIIATLNRQKELDQLLQSLYEQTINWDKFELIIVDQNPPGYLENIVRKYSRKLNIVHYISAERGLSKNRNIGIKMASGQYLAVPDDDCLYYSDTLENLEKVIDELEQPDMVIGRVFDRLNNKYIFKNSGNRRFILDKSNFYKTVSSISIFFKNEQIFFDEDFGLGAAYFSNEDGELILRFIEKRKKVIYCPEVECNHPPYDNKNMPPSKLYNYGIGFGSLCRKYLSGPLLILFIKSICFQFIMMAGSLTLLNGTAAARRWKAILGRIRGFLAFPALRA